MTFIKIFYCSNNPRLTRFFKQAKTKYNKKQNNVKTKIDLEQEEMGFKNLNLSYKNVES